MIGFKIHSTSIISSPNPCENIREYIKNGL